MRKELGQMIREFREKKRLEREDLARKLKITEIYVGHMERQGLATVFSDRIIDEVTRVLGLPPRKVRALAEHHNKRARRYRASLKTA